MKLPWRKWYPGDWLSDPEVGRASLIARGLWIELLNLMMLNRTGTITGTIEQLAQMTRSNRDDVIVALSDFDLCAMADISFQDQNGKCHASVTDCESCLVTVTNRRLQNECNDRDNSKLRKRKQRSNNTCHANVPSTSTSVLCTESKGVQGEREANGSSGTIPTFDEVKEYAAGHAVTFVVAQKFFDYYQGKNLWLNKHGRLVNWHYEIIVWQNNERSHVSPNGFHPSAPKAEIDKELAASRRWIDNWKMPESLL